MTTWPSGADPLHPYPEPERPRARHPDLRAALARAWAGEAPATAVAHLARAAGVDLPLAAQRHPLAPVPRLPDEATLARIATDIEPHVGNVAPDLILGPYADEPADVRTLQVVLALSLFFPHDAETVRAPYRRWQRTRPAPPRDLRAAVRAIADAPLAPWHIEQVSGSHARLRPVLFLGPPVVPNAPVPAPGGRHPVRAPRARRAPDGPGGPTGRRMGRHLPPGTPRRRFPRRCRAGSAGSRGQTAWSTAVP